jgi:hypothetical protein
MKASRGAIFMINPNDAISIVIPTSPLAINPSTEIVDETVTQVRKHLPDARIFLLMDGVHPEETYLTERYEEFKRRIREKNYGNFYHVTYEQWNHQSGMLREFLTIYEQLSKAPLIFWSEHDIPLRDEPIDWQGIVDTLFDGQIGGIRFELTGDKPKWNEVMGQASPHGVPLVLSTQFVNWPQVFRLDYLKEFVAKFGDAKTYLECSERDGIVAQLWHKWQYGIYSPEGEIRRCYHTHGRMRTGKEQGKPYIEVDGHKRHIYGSYWRER